MASTLPFIYRLTPPIGVLLGNLTVSQLDKNYCLRRELEDSLASSMLSRTGSFTDAVEFIPHTHTLVFYYQF